VSLSRLRQAAVTGCDSQMRSYRNILPTHRSEGASLATPGNNPALAEESSLRWCYQRTLENRGFWVPVARKQLCSTRMRIDHIRNTPDRRGLVKHPEGWPFRDVTNICAKIGAEQIVGSIPRCTLDYFRASQATHPPSSGIAFQHRPISLCSL